MTIRVSSERPTLSLPFNRLRSDDARGPATSDVKSGETGPAGVRDTPKTADTAQIKAAAAVLDRAASVADTAMAATTTVTGLLERLRAAALAAREPGAEPNGEFRRLGAQLAQTVKAATFDAVNLLDGSQAGGAFRVPTGGEGSEDLALSAFDLRPGGAAIPVSEDDDPASALEAVDLALAKVADARVRLEEDSKRLGAHRSFVQLLNGALGASGEGLGADGAKLAALQLRQSLGEQRLAIGNQAPRTVLALFR